MRSRLRRDLSAALKARDEVVVAALRSAIAAIDNAEAVATTRQAGLPASSQHIAGATAGVGSSEVPRRVLGGEDMNAVVRAQVEERWEAAEQYESLGRHDRAERLRREAAVLAAYLPE